MANDQFQKTAFTIVEVLTVLAILAIISAASIPSWPHFSAAAKLRAEGDKLIENLYGAQQRAVAEQYSHIIRFNPDSDSYKIVKLVLDDNNPLLITEADAGEFAIEGIDLQSTTFGGGELEFLPFGNPSYGGQIVLKNQKGAELIIEVSPAGIIKSTNTNL